MTAFPSWKRVTQPSVSSQQLESLLYGLYDIKEAERQVKLLNYRYADASGSDKYIYFPLFFEEADWTGTAETPLQVKAVISGESSPAVPVDDDYLRWKGQNKVISDNPVFRLNSIKRTSAGTFKLMFEKGTYAEYLCSCEILNDELLAQISSDNSLYKLVQSGRDITAYPDVIAGFRNKLPIRQRLAPSLSGLLDFGSRCVKAGVNVSMAFCTDAKKGEWVTLLSRRSRNVAEYPGTYGTIPSGTFQPSLIDKWDPDQDINESGELDLRYTVLREYLEEVFNRDNAGAEILSIEQLLDSPAVKDLAGLAESGALRFCWTGMAVTLETGKVELSALLRIDDPDYYRQYKSRMSSGWESGRIIRTGYNTHDVHPYLINYSLAPAAAMALCLGLKSLNAGQVR